MTYMNLECQNELNLVPKTWLLCAKSGRARNDLRRCAPNVPSGRGGNAALWKAWKTPRTTFPLFPQGLEIRPKAAGFPHFHRAGGGIKSTRKKARKDEEKNEFQLTDPITSSTIRTPASLRSESDHLTFGTSDRDQIGITDHLQRNTHHPNFPPFISFY